MGSADRFELGIFGWCWRRRQYVPFSLSFCSRSYYNSGDPIPNHNYGVPQTFGADVSVSTVGSYDSPEEARINPGDGSNSRWDDIRAVNKTSRNSTWDKIREVRQKSDMQNQNQDQDSDSNGSSAPSSMRPTAVSPPFNPSYPNRSSDSSTGRSTSPESEDSEQEKFNALLEAERKYGHEQDGFIPDSAVDGTGTRPRRR